MGLAAKLVGGFALVLAALATVVVVGTTRLTATNEAVTDVAEVHVPLMDAVSTIDVLACEQELAATLTAIHTDEREDLITEFGELDKTVDEQIALAGEILAGDEELMQRGWGQIVEEIATRHDEFVTECRAMIDATATADDRTAVEEAADRVAAAAARLMESVDGFLEDNQKELAGVASNAHESATNAKFLMMAVGISALVVGALLAVLIIRSITRPINRVIAGLNEGADQVNDASLQVSSASQQLAEGASEQASSLEETSSALEEMSAQTRKNAENAQKANDLAGQARKNADQGDETMAQLNTAMTAINES
ncbi:MAG: MCP four helix bundle domain-containing protein, partial [Planctomycetota bacterium]